jgi:hypothetical protein
VSPTILSGCVDNEMLHICISDSFKYTKSTCSSVNYAQRYDNFLSTSIPSTAVLHTLTLNLDVGYNLFTFSDLNNLGFLTGSSDQELVPGTYLQLQLKGTDGIVGLVSDVEFADKKEVSNRDMENSNGKLAFMVRLIQSPLKKVISTFKMYSSPGIYDMTVKVSNKYFPAEVNKLFVILN